MRVDHDEIGCLQSVRGGLRPLKLFLGILLTLAVAIPSFSQRVKNGQDQLDLLSFEKPEFRLTAQPRDINELRPELARTSAAMLSDLDAFTGQTGRPWLVEFDRVTGHGAILEGGLPWIPGAGNALKGSDIGVSESMAANNSVPLEIVAGKALELLKAYPNLLGVDTADLRLRTEASGPLADYLYFLWFDWTYKGVPVEKANVVFRLNSGNLVQFGQEYISDAIYKLDPEPSFTTETAWQIVWGYMGGKAGDDEILQPGRLVIMPMSTSEALSGTDVAPGTGLEYRLVYVLDFHRQGVLGNWQAKVDAHTGEILSFRDTNEYGHIQGGVYKTDKPYVASNPPSYSGPQTESLMPFPYADYGSGTYADAAGNFTGTTGTSTMTGRTGSTGNVGGVAIVDTCGSISLAATAGTIDFGTHSNTSTDCTTPGFGGAGNTHAARTQYWNIAQIKIKAYTYLTTNTWLQGRVTDTVNMNQTCNAYWGSGSLHFFNSGRYTGTGGFWMDCGNTGELPGVSLHEFGHGMDSNDGNGSSPDKGTGETYGDFTALLQTHQSCAGGGFLLNISSGTTKCGYGADACTSCTGVRDADYAQHSPATPATPSNYAGSSTVCPTSSTGYIGPCGREGHCESVVSTQAMWDLAVRDLTAAPYNLDSASAWQLTDKLWYLSRPTASAAFTCNKNGDDGCGTNSYYKVLRVADDCDGNLANGTPHAGAIWAAFNRHGIGCNADVRTDDACSSCPTLTTPALSGTVGNNQTSLTWAAVTGATSYDVMRNETGCTAGYTKIANVTGTSYTDNLAVNGIAYYYAVQAKASGSCPASPLSNCVTLTPSPCTTPGTPTMGTVTVPGDNQLTVSWTPGSSGGATYKIYRSTGACPGGVYSLVQSDQASSPWTDTSVSAGVTYSYKVSAVDITGGCESALSECAAAKATGICTAPPTFAGVTGISNPASATCTLNLSWSPATSNCSGTLSYNIYRSTSYPFTPSAGTRIAAGQSGTSFSDSYGLVNGTTYYYIVRAVDSASGSEDTNSAAQSGVPTGPAASGTWNETYEPSGNPINAGWTIDNVVPGASSPWAASTAQKHGGSASRFDADDPTRSDHAYETPSVTISATSVLSFWHTFSFENQNGVSACGTKCYDGGVLEYSMNGGAWTRITGAQITGSTYNGSIDSGSATDNPLGRSIPAWVGGTGTLPSWTQANVNIGSIAGAGNIRIRWRQGNDTANGTSGAVGWYIDDISLTNVQVSGSCATGKPPETAPGTTQVTAQTWSNKTTQSWPANSDPTVTQYNLYYGLLADLPNLVSGTANACVKYQGASMTATCSEDPTGKAGGFYWYLVTATGEGGDGTAGDATAGPRIVTVKSIGSCPP